METQSSVGVPSSLNDDVPFGAHHALGTRCFRDKNLKEHRENLKENWKSEIKIKKKRLGERERDG